MILLEANNLAIGYGKQPLLKNIHFQLKACEVCCLLGANGAGKSTFLKTLLGLQPPLAGKIYFQQHPIQSYLPQELACHIAYVPQAQHSLFPFSVQEMVLMGRSAYLKWHEQPKTTDIQTALDALAQLGITHLAERFYPQLSGGEKQLVLIARAIAQQAQILIMDEPTASLDFGNQIRVLEHIKQLQQKNIALLITTHNPKHADFLTQNIALLDQKIGFKQGSSRDLLKPKTLAKLYNISLQSLHQHLGELSLSSTQE